jgi:LPXTG-motif cell wall-anchored protein
MFGLVGLGAIILIIAIVVYKKRKNGCKCEDCQEETEFPDWR